MHPGRDGSTDPRRHRLRRGANLVDRPDVGVGVVVLGEIRIEMPNAKTVEAAAVAARRVAQALNERAFYDRVDW